MRVRILEPVSYEPISGDARSCFGQLAKRASRVPVVTKEIADDGTEFEMTVFTVGLMEHYFPKGRTPELRDDVAFCLRRDVFDLVAAMSHDGILQKIA